VFWAAKDYSAYREQQNKQSQGQK